MRVIGWWAVAAAAGLVLGGCTSLLQTVLPDGLRSFANSNGGWTILTFAVVVVCARWTSARPWWVGAVMGLLLFHGLLQGYTVVSTLRGFPGSYGPGDLYFTIATLAGPVIGVAGVWWWSERPVLRAVGGAVPAAVMIGDGVDGLLRVVETTGWIWWTISIVIGVAVLAWVVVRRLRSWGVRWLAVALTLVGAGAFAAVFLTVFGG